MSSGLRRGSWPCSPGCGHSRLGCCCGEPAACGMSPPSTSPQSSCMAGPCYGLLGCYCHLSHCSSDALWPGLLPSGHLRLLAQCCTRTAGSECSSAALPKGLGPEPACHTTPDGWSPWMLYLAAGKQMMAQGGRGE